MVCGRVIGVTLRQLTSPAASPDPDGRKGCYTDWYRESWVYVLLFVIVVFCSSSYYDGISPTSPSLYVAMGGRSLVEISNFQITQIF